MITPFQFAGTIAVQSNRISVSEAQTIEPSWNSHGEAPPPPVVTADTGSSVTPAYNVALREDHAWSNTKERRFSDLAAELALGNATEEQQAELDNLRGLRRRTKNPMSAKEIIFQYQRRQREIRLLSELQNYVEFLGRSR